VACGRASLTTPERSRSDVVRKNEGAIVSDVTYFGPYRPADAESNIAREGNARRATGPGPAVSRRAPSRAPAHRRDARALRRKPAGRTSRPPRARGSRDAMRGR